MIKRRIHGLALAATAALIGLGAERASARIPDLGDILKVGGIIFAVRQFGDEINKVINTALQHMNRALRGGGPTQSR